MRARPRPDGFGQVRASAAAEERVYDEIGGFGLAEWSDRNAGETGTRRGAYRVRAAGLAEPEDGDTRSPLEEHASGHVAVATVVARAHQNRHPRPVTRSAADRSHGHGMTGSLHGLVQIAAVGIVDPSALRSGDDRLHRTEVKRARPPPPP